MMAGLVWGSITLLFLVGAYLLGSLPTGYLVAKNLKGIDIREHGSGSTGGNECVAGVGEGTRTNGVFDGCGERGRSQLL